MRQELPCCYFFVFQENPGLYCNIKRYNTNDGISVDLIIMMMLMLSISTFLVTADSLLVSAPLFHAKSEWIMI